MSATGRIDEHAAELAALAAQVADYPWRAAVCRFMPPGHQLLRLAGDGAGGWLAELRQRRSGSVAWSRTAALADIARVARTRLSGSVHNARTGHGMASSRGHRRNATDGSTQTAHELARLGAFSSLLPRLLRRAAAPRRQEAEPPVAAALAERTAPSAPVGASASDAGREPPRRQTHQQSACRPAAHAETGAQTSAACGAHRRGYWRQRPP